MSENSNIPDQVEIDATVARELSRSVGDVQRALAHLDELEARGDRIIDPAAVEVGQPTDQHELFDRRARELGEDPESGTADVAGFYASLEALTTVSETDEKDDEEMDIIVMPLVDKEGTVNEKVLESVKETVNAGTLRDDEADGNEDGFRVHKGMVSGQPVFIVEELSTEFGSRVLAVGERSAREFLLELSEQDADILEMAGIEPHDEDIVGVDGSIVPATNRSSMRELLEQHAALVGLGSEEDPAA